MLTSTVAHDLIKPIHIFQLTWFWATPARGWDLALKLSSLMWWMGTEHFFFLLKSVIKMFSQAERSITPSGNSENTSFLFNNHPFHQLPLRKTVQLDNRQDFKVWKCETVDDYHHWATNLHWTAQSQLISRLWHWLHGLCAAQKNRIENIRGLLWLYTN